MKPINFILAVVVTLWLGLFGWARIACTNHSQRKTIRCGRKKSSCSGRKS